MNTNETIRGKKLRKVLFLCTGNSCRSQMAEAIANALFAGDWQAFSAGIRPAGFVHPKAVEALAEIGITHSGRSKPADEFRGQDFDLVVTVCDPAAEECPAWLGKGEKVHLDFPDPALVTGSEAERLNAFRALRDALNVQILILLQDRPNTHS